MKSRMIFPKDCYLLLAKEWALCHHDHEHASDCHGIYLIKYEYTPIIEFIKGLLDHLMSKKK